ncbi:MAG: hypothetical protein ACKVTZ_06995 [Bacteroidia bacterium]
MRKGFQLSQALVAKLWEGLLKKCPKLQNEKDLEHRARLIKQITAQPNNEKYEVGDTILMRMKQIIGSKNESLAMTHNVVSALCNYIENEELTQEIKTAILFGEDRAEPFFGEYWVYWCGFLSPHNQEIMRDFELVITIGGATFINLRNEHKYSGEGESKDVYQYANNLFLHLKNKHTATAKAYQIIVHLGLGDVNTRGYFSALYHTIDHDGIPVSGRMLLIRKHLVEKAKHDEEEANRLMVLIKRYFFAKPKLLSSHLITKLEYLYKNSLATSTDHKEAGLYGTWYLYRHDEKHRQVLVAKMKIENYACIQYEGSHLTFSDGQLKLYGVCAFVITLENSLLPLSISGSTPLAANLKNVNEIVCQYNTFTSRNTPTQGTLLMKREKSMEVLEAEDFKALHHTERNEGESPSLSAIKDIQASYQNMQPMIYYYDLKEEENGDKSIIPEDLASWEKAGIWHILKKLKTNH